MHRRGSHLQKLAVFSGLSMQNGCATDVWGLRGLAPVGALHTPHRAEARFWLTLSHPHRYMQSHPHRATTMRGKIAAVKVKFPFVEIDLSDSTSLP